MGLISKHKGFLALLTDGFLLAVFGLFTRVMGSYIGNYMQVFARMFLVALLLTPYLLINKKIRQKISVINPLLFLVFIISFPLYVLFFTMSVNSTKIADSFFYIFISTTIVSYALGKLYFKEKIGTKEIFVSALLIIGLICFAYPINGQKLFGALTGLLSGFLYGISNATRKFYNGKINRWMVIFLQMLAGSGIGLVLALLTHTFHIYSWSWTATLILLLYASGNIIFQILLFIGLKNFDLNLSSIVLASQLVFVLVVGIIFLHEIPTATELIGALVVLISIYIANIKNLTT